MMQTHRPSRKSVQYDVAKHRDALLCCRQVYGMSKRINTIVADVLPEVHRQSISGMEG